MALQPVASAARRASVFGETAGILEQPVVEAIPHTCLVWDPGRTEVAGEAHQCLRLLVRLNRSPLLAAFRSARLAAPVLRLSLKPTKPPAGP